MSQRTGTYHYWIDTEDVPVFLKVFSENRPHLGFAKLGIESLPDGMWYAVLLGATTRQGLLFSSAVYVELPEHEEEDVLTDEESSSFLSEATAQEDEEEHESAENLADLLHEAADEEPEEETPERAEVRRKLKAVKKLPVSTGDKNVSIEEG